MAVAAAALLAIAPSRDSLPQRIQSRIAQEPDAVVGLAYIDLASGDTLFLNADSSFHAASTMKVPVMIELFRRSVTGSFAMKQALMLVNHFASIVDGSAYALDPSSDSDTQRMQVLRGVEDGKAFEKGLNNTTTARDLAVILRAIEEGRAAAPTATREMLGILTAQEFNEKIPAGLPAGTRVAHKTGEITAVSHDAAIVYPPGRKPYVLVVLTRGIADGNRSSKLIADLSGIVYSYSILKSGSILR